MSRHFARRCAASMRRAMPTRRFNTTANPHGPTEGAAPHFEHDWVRRMKKFDKTFNQYQPHGHAYSHQQWGRANHHWGYKGPVIGLACGALVGYLARPSNATTEEEHRRMKTLARDLQDETRDLKVRLATIQQSIDALRVPQYTPVEHRREL
ncbi:Aste57867_7981 [Aphanomyces stellatus]|uniref:Aste57867_7981 protein n=1 Tax=Aphanomyces stellatus TaxID=120398 RepID=A0A485KJ37_9STRA|nr:hypothetical protein As57867_007951 [Aphanomyces stellatus]VFT84874.1 Aste57867_7981 [Aphanomyces stellatus]